MRYDFPSYPPSEQGRRSPHFAVIRPTPDGRGSVQSKHRFFPEANAAKRMADIVVELHPEDARSPWIPAARLKPAEADPYGYAVRAIRFSNYHGHFRSVYIVKGGKTTCYPRKDNMLTYAEAVAVAARRREAAERKHRADPTTRESLFEVWPAVYMPQAPPPK